MAKRAVLAAVEPVLWLEAPQSLGPLGSSRVVRCLYMSPAVQPWRGLAEAPPKRRFATLPPPGPRLLHSAQHRGTARRGRTARPHRGHDLRPHPLEARRLTFNFICVGPCVCFSCPHKVSVSAIGKGYRSRSEVATRDAAFFSCAPSQTRCTCGLFRITEF